VRTAAHGVATKSRTKGQSESESRSFILATSDLFRLPAHGSCTRPGCIPFVRLMVAIKFISRVCEDATEMIKDHQGDTGGSSLARSRVADPSPRSRTCQISRYLRRDTRTFALAAFRSRSRQIERDLRPRSRRRHGSSRAGVKSHLDETQVRKNERTGGEGKEKQRGNRDGSPSEIFPP